MKNGSFSLFFSRTPQTLWSLYDRVGSGVRIRPAYRGVGCINESRDSIAPTTLVTLLPANVSTDKNRRNDSLAILQKCFREGVVTIPKISSTIVGAAGEYHALSQLLRRGWVAALAPDGAPNMDILVTDEENNKLCAIQVKTRRDIGSDKGWHMKPKHEGMTAPDLFYVFVDVGSKPSDQTTCFILPSKTVADCIRQCHHVWLVTPGRGGRPHKDSNVRRLMPDYSSIRPTTPENIAIIDNYRSGWLEPFRENWGILGLPESASF